MADINVEILESELKFQDLKPDTKGAHKMVKRMKFADDDQRLAEIYGSMPGKASTMCINIINDFLIMYGDDGGLDDQDINNLQALFSSNNKGHGAFGMGGRGAARELVEATGKTEWSVVSKSGDIYRGVCFQCLDKDANITSSKLDSKRAEDIFNEYNCAFRSSNGITKWTVPVSKDFCDNELELKLKLKRRFSIPIFAQKIKIFFKGEKLSVNTVFYDNSHPIECEIISAKKYENKGEGYKGERSVIGNKFDVYKLGQKRYDGQCNPIDAAEIKQLSIKATFTLYYDNPSDESVDIIKKEYGLHKTLYNGLYFSQHQILLAPDGKLRYGQRNAGTDRTNHHIYVVNIEENNDSVIAKNPNKAALPAPSHMVKTCIDVFDIVAGSKKKNSQPASRTPDPLSRGNSVLNPKPEKIPGKPKSPTSPVHSAVKHVKQKNIHLGEGGWLYMGMYENSKDFIYEGEVVAAFGRVTHSKTSSRCVDDRFQEYQHHHPLCNFKVLACWYLPDSISVHEKKCLAMFKDASMQFGPITLTGTETSEWVLGPEAAIAMVLSIKGGDWITNPVITWPHKVDTY